MKRHHLLLLLLTLVSCGAQGKGDWREKYGLDPSCENPVFTRPSREVPGGRVAGAGINMNDGEAYQDYWISFSGEWHYAPKLSLCRAEAEQLHRITGVAPLDIEKDDWSGDLPRLVKFNVKPLNGCGALVIYRAFKDSRDVEQYIATYDAKGQLADVMSMGDGELIDLVFAAKPHKGYEPAEGRWSDIKGLINKDTTNVFTLEYRNYFERSDGKKNDWKMTRRYVVDENGIIHLDNVTQTDTLAFNRHAQELMELRLRPRSQYEACMTSLNALQPAIKSLPELEEEFSHEFDRLYAYDPQRFLVWVWKCKKCHLTDAIRHKLATDHYTTCAVSHVRVSEDVKLITDPAAQKYWMKMLSRWAESGD